MMRKFSKILALVLAFAMVLCPVLTAAAEAESDVLWSSAVLDVEDASAGATKAILTVDTIEEVNAINFAINFAKGVTFDPETAVVELVADDDSGEEVEVWNVVSSYEDGVLNVVAIDGDDMATVATHLVFNIDITVDNAADYEFYLTKIYAVGAGASDSDEVIAKFPCAENSQSGVIDVEAARTECPDYIVGATCAHANTSTETVDATCTEAGSTVVTCKDCGAVVSSAEVEALGHSFVGTDATYRVVVEPFGGAAGYAVYNALCDRDCGTWNDAYFNEDGTVKEDVDFAALVADGDPNVEEVFCEPATELSKDETGHWYDCDCGGKHEFAAHTAGDAVEVERVDAQPGVAGYYVTVVTCTECGYEISRTTNEIPALPEEIVPEEDASIVVRDVYVSITSTLDLRIRVRKSVIPADCARAEIVATPTIYDSSYNPTAGTVCKESFEIATASSNLTIYPKNFSLFALDLPMYVQINCYDANGNLYKYSPVYTYYPVDALKSAYKADSTSNTQIKLNAAITDLLNMSAASQVSFAANAGANSTLKATVNAGNLVNKGWSQDFASTAEPTYNTIDSKTYGEGFNATDNELRIAADLSGAPILSSSLRKATTAYPDTNKLSMTVSYTSYYGKAAGGEVVSDTIEGAEWAQYASGKHLVYKFRDCAMYDGNKTITVVVNYDGKEVVRSEYSLETYIAANSTGTTALADALKSMGKFGASIRAYFSTLGTVDPA